MFTFKMIAIGIFVRWGTLNHPKQRSGQRGQVFALALTYLTQAREIIGDNARDGNAPIGGGLFCHVDQLLVKP